MGQRVSQKRLFIDIFFQQQFKQVACRAALSRQEVCVDIRVNLGRLKDVAHCRQRGAVVCTVTRSQRHEGFEREQQGLNMGGR